MYVYPAGVQCQDVNECLSGAHDCHSNAFCNNLAGTFDCYCMTGYEGNGTSCTDVDECLMTSSLPNNCSSAASCQNLDGTYSCMCLAGYQGDGVRCLDVNECITGGHDCHTYADCSNNDGSYNCTCLAGFEGECGILNHTGTVLYPLRHSILATYVPLKHACVCGLNV